MKRRTHKPIRKTHHEQGRKLCPIESLEARTLLSFDITGHVGPLLELETWSRLGREAEEFIQEKKEQVVEKVQQLKNGRDNVAKAAKQGLVANHQRMTNAVGEVADAAKDLIKTGDVDKFHERVDKTVRTTAAETLSDAERGADRVLEWMQDEADENDRKLGETWNEVKEKDLIDIQFEDAFSLIHRFGNSMVLDVYKGAIATGSASADVSISLVEGKTYEAFEKAHAYSMGVSSESSITQLGKLAEEKVVDSFIWMTNQIDEHADTKSKIARVNGNQAEEMYWNLVEISTPDLSEQDREQALSEGFFHQLDRTFHEMPTSQAQPELFCEGKEGAAFIEAIADVGLEFIGIGFLDDARHLRHLEKLSELENLRHFSEIEEVVELRRFDLPDPSSAAPDVNVARKSQPDPSPGAAKRAEETPVKGPEEVPSSNGSSTSPESPDPANPVQEGKLTQDEYDALQEVANEHRTTIEVVGSRAKGEGREVGSDLPVGKGDGTRSDIDVRIDGERDIETRGKLTNDLREIEDGTVVDVHPKRPATPDDGPVIEINPQRGKPSSDPTSPPKVDSTPGSGGGSTNPAPNAADPDPLAQTAKQTGIPKDRLQAAQTIASEREWTIVLRKGNPEGIDADGLARGADTDILKQPEVKAKTSRSAVNSNGEIVVENPGAGTVVDPTSPPQREFAEQAREALANDPEALAKFEAQDRSAINTFENSKGDIADVEISGGQEKTVFHDPYNVNPETGQLRSGDNNIIPDTDVHVILDKDGRMIDLGPGEQKDFLIKDKLIEIEIVPESPEVLRLREELADLGLTHGGHLNYDPDFFSGPLPTDVDTVAITPDQSIIDFGENMEQLNKFLGEKGLEIPDQQPR